MTNKEEIYGPQHDPDPRAVRLAEELAASVPGATVRAIRSSDGFVAVYNPATERGVQISIGSPYSRQMGSDSVFLVMNDHAGKGYPRQSQEECGSDWKAVACDFLLGDPPERMLGGELWVVREGLGMTRPAMAKRLGVREDTVRKWELGKDPIPYRVRDEVEALEAHTAEAVGTLVDALNRSAHVAVAVYRAEDDFAGRPDIQELGAGWWRMVVWRASLEVPGAVIGLPEELSRRVDTP